MFSFPSFILIYSCSFNLRAGSNFGKRLFVNVFWGVRHCDRRKYGVSDFFFTPSTCGNLSSSRKNTKRKSDTRVVARTKWQRSFIHIIAFSQKTPNFLQNFESDCVQIMLSRLEDKKVSKFIQNFSGKLHSYPLVASIRKKPQGSPLEK